MTHAAHVASSINHSHARMNAQVEAAQAHDLILKSQAVLGKPPSIQSLMAPAAAAAVSLAQMRALAAKLDFTGEGKFNAADIPGLQNAIANLSSWASTTQAPTNVAASASAAGAVTVSWFQQADPAGLDHVNVLRNGAVIGTTGPGGLTFTDTPGNGTWSYQVQNVSASYEGELSVTATVVVGVTPPPTSGWTDLTPAIGAQVIHVSSSTGDDAAAGTPNAPLRTIAAGYAKLRDGQPDQVLLKRGDTFNESIGWSKASGNAAKPMVCSSYGTGPRPKIRGGGFYGGQQNKGGLIFAHLDVAPSTPGGGTNGFCFFAPWHDLTIEGCLVSSYYVNVAMQEIDATRLARVRFFRCAIVDGMGGGGHNQGLFVGSCDNLIVEECFFDLNGNVPGFEKLDMFCHNVYLHETNGPSTFKNNVTARACSHGVQQRSGGVMDGNLALYNPIGLFQGDASNVYNYFRFNGCVGSRNISATELRGFGHWVNGGAGIDVLNNFAAHQHEGTANCEAFEFDGVSGAVVKNNVALDWICPGNEPWGHGFTGSGVAVFQNNKSYQPNGGQCVFDSSGGSRVGNHYWSTSANCFNGQPWTAYQSQESGSTFANPGPLDCHVEKYMVSLGRTGGVAEFMAECRKQEIQNWRPEFTAQAFNTWARNVLGIAQPT